MHVFIYLHKIMHNIIILIQICKKNSSLFFPGLPSQPVVLYVSAGSESAAKTLKVDCFGVLVASNITFMVSVFNLSDTTNPVAVRMINPDSIVSPIVAIVVEGLSEGTNLFTVTSRNIYTVHPSITLLCHHKFLFIKVSGNVNLNKYMNVYSFF